MSDRYSALPCPLPCPLPCGRVTPKAEGQKRSTHGLTSISQAQALRSWQRKCQ